MSPDGTERRPENTGPGDAKPAFKAQIPRAHRTWRHWLAAALVLAVVAGGAAVGRHYLATRPPQPEGPVAAWSSPPLVGEYLPTAGATHTCLVTHTGTALCWGTGAVGQLGIATRRIALTPMAVTAGARFRSVSAGENHTCGAATDGAVLCWGLNEEGQSGANTGAECTASGVDYACVSPPTPVAGVPRVRSVRAGGSFTCGLAEDGAAWCWGGNRRGQMGRSTGHAWDPPGPVGGTGGPHFRDLAAGQFHACGITTGDSVVCWGWGLYGQLGTTAQTSRCTSGEPCADAPAPVALSGVFTKVAAGAGHSCALAAGGRAFCWGSNTHGQLGVGSTRDRSLTPLPVAGRHEYTAIAAGSYFTCGLTAAGEVWCWGDNASGQLGTVPDSLPQSISPIRVPLAGRALSLGAGDRHACGILEGDQVVCWGNDGAGQLGDGQTAPSEPPITVRPDSTRQPAAR